MSYIRYEDKLGFSESAPRGERPSPTKSDWRFLSSSFHRTPFRMRSSTCQAPPGERRASAR